MSITEIKNNQEYQLVLEYLERFLGKDPTNLNPAEVKRLIKLIEEYEASIKKEGQT
ncbi:hypothetical protein [Membranihabitans maritimus]|uniref:hypothetical protein n=1 Tax=Membranihabitans maritimus TaxID=2904244 RepID=UPI001F22DF3D|nr:hypothetical protein [Membranihabitans maritimus]